MRQCACCVSLTRGCRLIVCPPPLCPHTRQIREQCRLMHLHRVLSSYSVRDFNLADDTHAFMLLHHVAAQCHRPTCAADALSLVEAYSCLHPHLARSVCIQNLIQSGPHVSEAGEEVGLGGAAEEGEEGGAAPVVGATLVQVASARAARVLEWLQVAGASEFDQLSVGQEVLQACLDVLDGYVEDGEEGPVAAAMAEVEALVLEAVRAADGVEDEGACAPPILCGCGVSRGAAGISRSLSAC